MPLFALNLILPVKRFLGALWAWFTANPWRLTLIVIAVLCVALWAKSNALDSTRETIAAMKQASKDAEAAQVAVNTKRTTDERTIADGADLSHAEARLEGERRAVVYRDRWRVRNVCASSQADTASADPVAESGDGAGAAADMVAISERDFNVCTANSIRLQAVNKWGDRLIDEGMAVATEDEKQ